MAVTDRSVISRTIAQHIQSVTPHSMSARTIRRRSQQSCLSARRPLLGLPLTQNHRRLRHQWCDDRRIQKPSSRSRPGGGRTSTLFCLHAPQPPGTTVPETANLYYSGAFHQPYERTCAQRLFRRPNAKKALQIYKHPYLLRHSSQGH
ncbi:transposable element Tc1 transposase [Trichonephila clavipes]|nr:transposable element Tc1 transposase [Trichonephila clavipes]